MCGIVGVALPRVRLQCRKFVRGDYTLANDESEHKHSESVDVNLTLLCDAAAAAGDARTAKRKRVSWPQSYGGGMHYIVEGDRDELLHIKPTDNALSIVYRAPQTKHNADDDGDSKNEDDVDAADTDDEDEDDAAGGVLRFVEHISSRAGERIRYDLDVVYHAE